MPASVAIGTSLVVVTALGASTAGSYALSGYVDWPLVCLLVLGGLAGSLPGQWAGRALAGHKQLLSSGFAVLVMAIGGYVVWRGIA
jgi:uncharacterized membrane protein YfcA